MGVKSISKGVQPTTEQASANDANARSGDLGEGKEPKHPMRFSVDVPEDLHRALKIASAEHGVTMIGEIRNLFAKYGIK